jgi:hypothetical protein
VAKCLSLFQLFGFKCIGFLYGGECFLFSVGAAVFIA